MIKTFKIISAIVVFILTVGVFAACDGDKTNDAEQWQPTDLNGDSVIDETDRELFIAYQKWKLSDDAVDINGDRKITIDDYRLYNDYIGWKLSDDATDYNCDSKIDMEDFKFYSDPSHQDYITWQTSLNAYDFTEDGIIDENDFAFYLFNRDFIGEFRIRNYIYRCNDTNNDCWLENSGFRLSELRNYIEDIRFSVSHKLQLNCEYGDELREKLGTDVEVVENAIKSCTFEKLSDLAHTATFIINSNGQWTFTLYLTKTAAGFSSTTNFSINNLSATVSFDIVYET